MIIAAAEWVLTLALAAFTLVIVGASVWRFRKQLG